MSRSRPQTDEAGRRSPGRPRSRNADEAILDAALKLLTEQGYARMSLEGIAAAAAVSRPTLYRRWSSKADVAMAALAHRIDVEEIPTPTTPTRDALASVMRNIAARLFRDNGMNLLGTLLAEETQTPELIRLFRDRVFRRRFEMLRGVLERGREHGEVRADADLETTVHMMIGAMYAQYMSGRRPPRDWLERIVQAVWRGVGEAETANRKRARLTPTRCSAAPAR
jgi:AcrR family transcriptional regulator